MVLLPPESVMLQNCNAKLMELSLKKYLFPPGCGTDLRLGYLHMLDGNHGDWTTDSARIVSQYYGQNYIMVSL